MLFGKTRSYNLPKVEEFNSDSFHKKNEPILTKFTKLEDNNIEPFQFLINNDDPHLFSEKVARKLILEPKVKKFLQLNGAGVDTAGLRTFFGQNINFLLLNSHSSKNILKISQISPERTALNVLKSEILFRLRNGVPNTLALSIMGCNTAKYENLRENPNTRKEADKIVSLTASIYYAFNYLASTFSPISFSKETIKAQKVILDALNHRAIFYLKFRLWYSNNKDPKDFYKIYW